MRGNSLGGSLLFAAVVALGFVPFALAARPILGGADAVTLYQLGSLVLYAATIAPSLRRGLRIGLLAAALVAAVALIAAAPYEALLGGAVVVAVLRSGFLYRSRPARALLTELLLIGGGVLFGRWLGGGGSLLSIALGLWGFYLVQSLFFVIGGVSERRPVVADGDAFERAHARALNLLDELG